MGVVSRTMVGYRTGAGILKSCVGKTLLLLVWGLAVLAFANGCSSDDYGESNPSGVAGPVLEQVFLNQETVETENGERKWVLKSDQMQKFSGRKEVLLIDLTMDFYRDNAIYSTLVADSGQANPSTHDVHAWGNVVIEAEDGRRLETEDLYYDNKTQLISNDVFGRYTWSDGEATGIGMEASADLDYLEIKRNFNSEIGAEKPVPPGGSR